MHIYYICIKTAGCCTWDSFQTNHSALTMMKGSLNRCKGVAQGSTEPSTVQVSGSKKKKYKKKTSISFK